MVYWITKIVNGLKLVVPIQLQVIITYLQNKQQLQPRIFANSTQPIVLCMMGISAKKDKHRQLARLLTILSHLHHRPVTQNARAIRNVLPLQCL